eukprot:scaffold676138_cov63-Attheya_sp.AAC.1
MRKVKNKKRKVGGKKTAYEQKANMIEEYQKWKEKNINGSTQDYIMENSLPLKYQYCFFTAGTKGWLSKERLDSIMKNAAESKYKHLKRPIRHDQAKYPAMEQALYHEILARRRRGAKVSSNFMQIKARLEMDKMVFAMLNSLQESKPTMLIIAKKFCIKKRERHGNRQVLLFADNLDAHCWEEVLNEFARANVLV